MADLTEALLGDEEIRKALAEKARAEAEKAKAEAEAARLSSRIAEIQLAQVDREEQDILAEDGMNHVYHFNSSVTEGSVKTCMNTLSRWARQEPGCEISVVVNSPGGDVIEGMALFDHIIDLRQRGHAVHVTVRGMAASMAGILLQAGTTRTVGKEAWVLIHRAAFGAIGKSFEIEDKVEWVKRIEARIIDIFVQRSKEAADAGTATKPLTKAKVKKNWERKDWWLTSDECIEYGVADRVA